MRPKVKINKDGSVTITTFHKKRKSADGLFYGSHSISCVSELDVQCSGLIKVSFTLEPDIDYEPKTPPLCRDMLGYANDGRPAGLTTAEWMAMTR